MPIYISYFVWEFGFTDWFINIVDLYPTSFWHGYHDLLITNLFRQCQEHTVMCSLLPQFVFINLIFLSVRMWETAASARPDIPLQQVCNIIFKNYVFNN